MWRYTRDGIIWDSRINSKKRTNEIVNSVVDAISSLRVRLRGGGGLKKDEEGTDE
jgi:hypothetical protein